ncbi:MAG: bifunctional oligoribonuclease/PAP phosphatase NrnA [Gemmatimonadota bacterium]
MRLALRAAERVVLTTHVNADGDGAGSETAVAHYVSRQRIRATIVNPTPFPDSFRFLLDRIDAFTPGDEAGRIALREAGLVLVLDTAEPSRLGGILPALEGKRVAVLDHHPPTASQIGDPAVQDPSACATGELVYDLITADGGTLTEAEARGLYVALVTDTGSFRFSNTSPRTHEIVAELLRAGVDPGEMYRRLFGQVTPGRLRLMQRALSSLHVHPELPLAWIALRESDLRDCGTGTEDMEGIIEYARQIQGVEVAMLVRELPDRRTKVSLRSNGDVDVAHIARSFGGGGHVKAAGLLIALPLTEAVAELLPVLDRALRGGQTPDAPPARSP